MNKHGMLCALNLSGTSADVARRVTFFHKAKFKTVHFLHTIDPKILPGHSFVSGEGIALLDKLQTSAMSCLQTTAESAGVSYAELLVTTGNVPDSVTAHAVELDASLLIIGSHLRQDAIADLFLGSTANKIVRSSPCPILLAKKMPASKGYANVIIAVDFSENNMPMVQFVREILPDAKITLIHIYETPFEHKLHYADLDELDIKTYKAYVQNAAIEQMNQLCQAFGTTDISTLILQGDAPTTILNQAKKLKADLIVMGKNKQTMPQEMILGSVTNQVINSCDSDVLIYK